MRHRTPASPKIVAIKIVTSFVRRSLSLCLSGRCEHWRSLAKALSYQQRLKKGQWTLTPQLAVYALLSFTARGKEGFMKRAQVLH
jgi:hypothetical protein